jgi:hypothetical protein
VTRAALTDPADVVREWRVRAEDLEAECERQSAIISGLRERIALLERVAEAAQDYMTRHREGDTTYEAWGRLRDSLDKWEGQP